MALGDRWRFDVGARRCLRCTVAGIPTPCSAVRHPTAAEGADACARLDVGVECGRRTSLVMRRQPTRDYMQDTRLPATPMMFRVRPKSLTTGTRHIRCTVFQDQ